MNETFIAVFTSNNCRIVKDDPQAFASRPECVIDPVFDHLLNANIPPHLWKRGEGNRLEAMNDDEARARIADIQEKGADNDTATADEKVARAALRAQEAQLEDEADASPGLAEKLLYGTIGAGAALAAAGGAYWLLS